MSAILGMLLANALVAGVLAIAGALVWRWRGNAPVAHGLLVLSLLKLVTPPLFDVGVAMPLPSGRDAAVVERDVVVEPASEPEPEAMRGEVAGPPPGVTAEFARMAPDEEAGVALAPAPVSAGPSWLETVDWTVVLGVVWILGSSITLLVVVRRARHFRRLLMRADKAPEPVVAHARALAGALGLRRTPDVRVIDARMPPFVFALTGRLTVVLPRPLLRDLRGDDLRAVLAHELSHVANRDHLTRWLEVAVVTVHWWNPIAQWARRLLAEIGEVRCDARAVEVLATGARPYGRSILRITSQLDVDPSQVPLGASGFGGSRVLKRRLTMIADSKLSHRLAWPARLALVVGAVGLLPLGLVAQEKKSPKSSGKMKVRVETKGSGGINAEALEEAIEKAVKSGVGKKIDREVMESIGETIEKAVQEALEAAGVESFTKEFELGPRGKSLRGLRERIEKGKSGKVRGFTVDPRGVVRRFTESGEEIEETLEKGEGKAFSRVIVGPRGRRVFSVGPHGLDVKEFVGELSEEIDEEIREEIEEAMAKGKNFSRSYKIGPHGRGRIEIRGDGGNWKEINQEIRKKIGESAGNFDFDFSFGRDGDGAVFLQRGTGKDGKARVFSRIFQRRGADAEEDEEEDGDDDEIRTLKSQIKKLEKQLRSLKKKLDRKIV